MSEIINDGQGSDQAGPDGPARAQLHAAVFAEIVQTARRAELLDVLAYLARRRDNAALVAAQMPELEPLAADRRRQLEVMIDEIEAGLHQGLADVLGELGVLGLPTSGYAEGI